MIISGYNVDMIRNISGYKYVDKLNLKEKMELRDKVISSVQKINMPLKYIPSYNSAGGDVEIFQERNLLSMTITEESDPAVLYNEDEELILIINDVDHVLISAKGKNWNDSYNKVLSVANALESDLPFQKDRSFGYLTASVPLCGNGIVFDTLLHLPALMTKNRIIQSARKVMKKPGGLLIPFNNATRPSAFFVLRIISKGNVEDELNFIKNIAEELCIMEAAETNALKADLSYLKNIEERIDKYKNEGKVSFLDFLRLVDDIVIYKKIIDQPVEADRINDLLVSTQPEHMNSIGIPSSEQEEYYHKKIFELM